MGRRGGGEEGEKRRRSNGCGPADRCDEVRVYDGDQGGVGEVEEGREADHQVSRQQARLPHGHYRPG